MSEKLSNRAEATSNEDAELHIIKPIGGGVFQSWRIKLVNFLRNFVTDFILFTPQAVEPTVHAEGKQYYNEVEHAMEIMNDVAGVRLSVGEEMWARLINNTAGQLPNGKVGYISDVDGVKIECRLAIGSNLDQSIRTLGLFTNDIEIGLPGYITTFGAVRGLNTIAWAPNTILYMSADVAGELTDIKPIAPNYTVRIGIVIVQDASEGVIGVDTRAFNGSDTDVNIQGIINGIVTQTSDNAVSVDGGIIYVDVTNEVYPTKNLPFMLDGMRYLLDTTTNTGLNGAARVVIPPGASDILKQRSFLYITLVADVPTLTISTTPPVVPFAFLAQFSVYNAARTLAEGKPFNYRRSNDAINSLTEGLPGAYGLIKVILSAMRFKLGSGWLTGQDATPTVNDTTIKVAMSAGIAAQLHPSDVPLFDGDNYFIYNTIANVVTNAPSINLTDIVTDAAGVTLLSPGTYYTIRLFYQLNSNGVGNSVIATRPLGSYNTEGNAIADALGYTVNVNDTEIEENIYKLYDIVIGRTGGSGAIISLIQLTDLRTKLVGQGGGGGGATGAGPDDKVRASAADTINSYLNEKLIGSQNVSLDIINPGGNEQIVVSVPINSLEKDPFTETIEIASLLQHSPNYTQISELNIIKGGVSFIGGTYQLLIETNNQNILFSSDFYVFKNDYSMLDIGVYSFIFAYLSNGKIGVTISNTNEDITAPLLISATIENSTPDELDLIFSEAVTLTNLGYSISGIVSSPTITGVIGSGSAVITLNLSDITISTDIPLLSYNSISGDTQDLNSNVLASFTDTPITNNVASTFTPADLGAAKLWYWGEDSRVLANTTNDTTNISQWTDKSGNVVSMAAPAGTNEPLYNVIKGALFDGIDDYFTAAITKNEAIEIFFKGSVETWKNLGQIIKLKKVAVDEAYFRVVGSGADITFSYSGAGAGLVQQSNSIAEGDDVFVRLLINGTTSEISVNNATPSAGDGNTVNPNFDEIQLPSSGGLKLNCGIIEIAFTAELTTNQRNDMINYFNAI